MQFAQTQAQPETTHTIHNGKKSSAIFIFEFCEFVWDISCDRKSVEMNFHPFSSCN